MPRLALSAAKARLGIERDQRLETIEDRDMVDALAKALIVAARRRGDDVAAAELSEAKAVIRKKISLGKYCHCGERKDKNAIQCRSCWFAAKYASMTLAAGVAA